MGLKGLKQCAEVKLKRVSPKNYFSWNWKIVKISYFAKFTKCLFAAPLQDTHLAIISSLLSFLAISFHFTYLLTYYLLSLTFSVFYRSQTCHDRLPFRLLPRAHYNFTLVVTEGNLKTYLCGLMWGKCVALSCWREKVGLVAAFSWEVDLWRGALVWTIKYMIYMPSSAVILEFRVGFGVNAEIKAQAWYDCLFLYW